MDRSADESSNYLCGVWLCGLTCFLSVAGTWLKYSQACQNKMFSSLNSFLRNSCRETHSNHSLKRYLFHQWAPSLPLLLCGCGCSCWYCCRTGETNDRVWCCEGGVCVWVQEESGRSAALISVEGRWGTVWFWPTRTFEVLWATFWDPSSMWEVEEHRGDGTCSG